MHLQMLKLTIFQFALFITISYILLFEYHYKVLPQRHQTLKTVLLIMLSPRINFLSKSSYCQASKKRAFKQMGLIL